MRPFFVVRANDVSVFGAVSRLHGPFAPSVSGVRNPVPHALWGDQKASARGPEAIRRKLLIRVEAEIAELRSPEWIGISQALDIDTARESTFDGSFDK